MSDTLPPPLLSLLSATHDSSREAAWSRFLEEYSDLILRSTHAPGGDVDDRMDRYAFVIEQLQRDDYRRLRQFVADGRAQFTTWLVLVIRRLCLDEHRRRHGRPQGTDAASRERHEMRRRLFLLVGSDGELADLPEEGNDPDGALRTAELHDALDRAIATLETRQRLLLRLRFEDGESVPTIARILRAPSVGHVYRRLDALLTDLRTKLMGAGVRDSQP